MKLRVVLRLLLLVSLLALAWVSMHAQDDSPSVAELAAANKAKAAKNPHKVYDDDGVMALGRKSNPNEDPSYNPCDDQCEAQIRNELNVPAKDAPLWKEVFYDGLRDRSGDTAWVDTISQYRAAKCGKSGVKAVSATTAPATSAVELEKKINERLETEKRETQTVVQQAYRAGEQGKWKEFVVKLIKLDIMRHEFMQLSSASCQK